MANKIMISDEGGTEFLDIKKFSDGYAEAVTESGHVVILIEPPPELTEEEWAYCVDCHGYEPSTQAEKERMLAGAKIVRPRAPAYTDKHNLAVKAARKTAKENNWVALIGTTKQKRWAEQIREVVIPSLPDELATFAGNFYNGSSFWIENRENKLVAKIIADEKSAVEQRDGECREHAEAEKSRIRADNLRIEAATEELITTLSVEIDELFDSSKRDNIDNKGPVGRKIFEMQFRDGNLMVYLNSIKDDFYIYFRSNTERSFFPVAVSEVFRSSVREYFAEKIRTC